MLEHGPHCYGVFWLAFDYALLDTEFFADFDEDGVPDGVDNCIEDLLRLSFSIDVDMYSAVKAKIALNNRKYPASICGAKVGGLGVFRGCRALDSY